MVIGLDISVLNDENRTGIAVYTYGLIKALLKLDRQDEFILFGFSTFQTDKYLKNLEFKDYPNVKIKTFKLPARLFSKTFLLWQKLNYPKIEDFIGPVDIFHSFNWYLPPQKAGKKVATVFDLTALFYPNLHHKNTIRLDKTRFESIKKQADLILAISESTKKDFLKFSPKSRVEVIYPGLSLPLNYKRIDIFRKYKLKPNFILSVATIEPRKNIRVLIKAYLKSQLKNELVLVGGEGWKSKELIKFARKYPQIKLVGFIPGHELPLFYKNALFLAYPSLYEGFGLPILEALSYGTAVLTSKVSSLPEVGGEAVLYVDPKDEKDISKKLVQIARNSEVRKGLIIKGFKQANRFSFEKSAKKLLKLYRSI